MLVLLEVHDVSAPYVVQCVCTLCAGLLFTDWNVAFEVLLTLIGDFGERASRKANQDKQ